MATAAAATTTAAAAAATVACVRRMRLAVRQAFPNDMTDKLP